MSLYIMLVGDHVIIIFCLLEIRILLYSVFRDHIMVTIVDLKL